MPELLLDLVGTRDLHTVERRSIFKVESLQLRRFVAIGRVDEQELAGLAEFGSRPLGSFDRVELQDWLESKIEEGLSHSTIDHLRWDLNQIFKMAAAEGRGHWKPRVSTICG